MAFLLKPTKGTKCESIKKLKHRLQSNQEWREVRTDKIVKLQDLAVGDTVVLLSQSQDFRVALKINVSMLQRLPPKILP